MRFRVTKESPKWKAKTLISKLSPLMSLDELKNIAGGTFYNLCALLSHFATFLSAILVVEISYRTQTMSCK
jgi:hypothetical protein